MVRKTISVRRETKSDILSRIHHELHELREEVRHIHHQLEKVMATQAEEATILRNVLAQQVKTAGEIATVQQNVTDLNTKVAELQAIIDAGTGTAGAATQELIDAVEAVRAQAQVVDDSIPDVPVTARR